MISRITGKLKEASSAEAPPDSKLYLLEQADLFRDLSANEMEQVDRVTTMTTCRRGRIFYTPGQEAPVLFILKKGRVQLYRIAEDGRRLVTAIVHAGSIFGEMPLLSQRMHDNVAEALEDCTLCVMSRADIEHLLESNPRIALNVISILAGRLAAAERRIEIQTYASVRERLCGILLHLAGNGREVHASHQQLGELIGASRETVTRMLGELKAEGVVDLSRSHVTILARKSLKDIAGAEAD